MTTYHEDCEGDVDAEFAEAMQLFTTAVLEFEDANGRAVTHVIIPKDLEIQSLLMFVCEGQNVTYELSDDAKEVYCT